MRNHAMMVFDTLFAADADNAISPQMLAGRVVEDDGRTWRLTLREGLTFHDGTPVLARDCVASIKQWSLRDNFGKTVATFTDEMTAPDDRTIQIRLKRAFPLLAAALGKGGSSVCAMMPERLAGGDPSKPITEVVGSGPYRFVAGERNTVALVVYARFDRYVPRSDGTPSFIAGPKVANFDRIEWHIIPDQATAAAALQAGEIDWWEVPTSDLWPVIEKNARLTLKVHDRTGYLGFMRFNQLTAPFNNPAIRRALFDAVDQDEFMEAVVGDNTAMRRSGVGYFCPTSPMCRRHGCAHRPTGCRQGPGSGACRRLRRREGGRAYAALLNNIHILEQRCLFFEQVVGRAQSHLPAAAGRRRGATTAIADCTAIAAAR